MNETDNTILVYLHKLDEKLDRLIEELRELKKGTTQPMTTDPAEGQQQPSKRTEQPPNVLLDAKGLNCPVPVLKASKLIKDVPIGGTLEVLATDPGSIPDFQSFCRQTGHELVESGRKGDIYRLVVRRRVDA